MKKNNNTSPQGRNALDRMKLETAGDVLGYNSGAQAAAAGQTFSNASNKMLADGEVEAENLGNATIENKYNSSK